MSDESLPFPGTMEAVQGHLNALCNMRNVKNRDLALLEFGRLEGMFLCGDFDNFPFKQLNKSLHNLGYYTGLIDCEWIDTQEQKE